MSYFSSNLLILYLFKCFVQTTDYNNYSCFLLSASGLVLPASAFCLVWRGCGKPGVPQRSFPKRIWRCGAGGCCGKTCWGQPDVILLILIFWKMYIFDIDHLAIKHGYRHKQLFAMISDFFYWTKTGMFNHDPWFDYQKLFWTMFIFSPYRLTRLSPCDRPALSQVMVKIHQSRGRIPGPFCLNFVVVVYIDVDDVDDVVVVFSFFFYINLCFDCF